ncbi:hypothetical protein ISCGN_004954 [Ixodes scapularis]
MSEVASIVAGSGLPSVHLLGPCPKEHRKPSSGRGAAGRRRALQWLRQNASLPGVLYFADDDNTYDFRLFDEMRWVRKVGVLPVGLVGRFGVSSPVVVAGRVVGFHDSFDSGRTFPVDMAGFAVNLRLVLDGQPDMPYVLGMQETRFLESLNVTTAQLEPLARNCTQASPANPNASKAADTDRGYGSMELNTGNGPNSTASQPPQTKGPEAQAGTVKENAETSRTATSTEQVRNYSQQDVSGDVQDIPVLAHEGDPNFSWTDVVGKNTKKKRARAERLQGNDPSTSNRQIENNKMATGKGDGGKDGGPPAIPTSTYRNGGHRKSKPRKELLPPLPLNHYKVVIRPQEGLTVSNWSALEISKAITTAAKLSLEELAKSRVRIRKEQNIIVLSTPDIDPANRMAKAKTITLKDRQYEIAAYKAAPDNSCKGVISGIGEKYAPEYLTENIRAISSTGPAVFYARMMGQKDSVIITFQGLQVPRLVLLGNAEYRCRPYLPKEQVCDACLGHGHRKDVCPHPEKGRCATCGCLGGAMEDHVCSPHCIHCEGNHPSNDPQCPARRKAPYNKAWIQKQQTQKGNLQQTETSNTQNIRPDPTSQRKELLPPTRNSQAHWPALGAGGFETPNPYALIASGLESYARTLAQAPHATQGRIVDPMDTGLSGGNRGRSRSRKKSQVKSQQQPQELPHLLQQQQGGSHRQGPSGLTAVNTQVSWDERPPNPPTPAPRNSFSSTSQIPPAPVVLGDSETPRPPPAKRAALDSPPEKDDLENRLEKYMHQILDHTRKEMQCRLEAFEKHIQAKFERQIEALSAQLNSMIRNEIQALVHRLQSRFGGPCPNMCEGPQCPYPPAGPGGYAGPRPEPIADGPSVDPGLQPNSESPPPPPDQNIINQQHFQQDPALQLTQILNLQHGQGSPQ